ncbi:MAG TPA: hypothetical protein DDW19_09245 [Anaerolineaceae bacterium]|jgi:hypothetical protein|nr:hypothetical protein [Anaerolineaceae bacterium]
MKKEQILDKINLAWKELLDAVEGLTPVQMTLPGVTGNWSVKDILAHVTWWEEECLKYLPVILEGGHPPRYSVMYGGIDAFNAQMTEARQKLPLEEVLKSLQETHRLLLTYLVNVPEEQFATETRFRRRLKYDTFTHYPEHAAAIREWRSRS